ncbi:sugar transferase [Rhodonellum sp.]|uniref:sugar transferase n=1 Tax=Rhodonellum sp. TaxID=2231180 RepID=UPI00271A97D8|nr:sugar transferase [Rhodonellum sp.]MDO9551558.1 sugar transferase [Rhodonellum sp.]
MNYPKILKSAIDFLGSFLLLLILWPVIFILYLLLFFFQSRQVFFVHERPGKDRKVFKLMKFKTMNDKKDADGKLLPDSKRLTPIGKFIRSISLDELPQLLNVLKGEMSLIGPRPLLVRYLAFYSPEQARRHEVKPGITGWAQVNGRNAISWEQKFHYDVWYVDHVSFLVDLKILWLTFKKVIIRDGISSKGQATTLAFKGSETVKKKRMNYTNNI